MVLDKHAATSIFPGPLDDKAKSDSPCSLCDVAGELGAEGCELPWGEAFTCVLCLQTFHSTCANYLRKTLGKPTPDLDVDWPNSDRFECALCLDACMPAGHPDGE